jgi:DNA-binding NarL/FixJ family response regulator
MIKSKISILIVDDNVNFVGRLLTLLNDVESIGLIHLARDYEEAYELLDRNPDIILLDIQLPGKNGISLLKGIKEMTDTCKVVMLSNHTSEHYRDQCTKLGAAHFLDKTSEFELVPRVVRELAMQN